MKNNEEMLKKFPTMKSLDADKKASKTSEAAPAAAEVKAEPEKIDFSKVKIEPLFEEAVDFDTFSKSDFRAVKVKECVAVPKSKKLLQFTLDDGTGTDIKESPVGRAVLGHRAGDRVQVQMENGSTYWLQIRSVEKGRDDGSIPIGSF